MTTVSRTSLSFIIRNAEEEKFHHNGINSIIAAPLHKGILTAGRDGIVREYSFSKKKGTSLVPASSTSNCMDTTRDDDDADDDDDDDDDGDNESGDAAWIEEGIKLRRQPPPHSATRRGRRRAKPRSTPVAELSKVFATHANWVNDVVVSAEHGFVITASSDSTVRVWDYERASVAATLTKHCDYVKGISYSASTRQFVSCGLDRRLIMWDLGQEKVSCTIDDSSHPEGILACKLCSDGSLIVTGSTDKYVRCFDPRAKGPVAVLNGHRDMVKALCINGRGHLVVSGSSDNTAKVWDMRAGKCLRTCRAFRDSVWSLAPTHDFTHAYAGARDGCIYRFSTMTNDPPEAVAQYFDPILSLCLSHDDEVLWTGTTAPCLDALSVACVERANAEVIECDPEEKHIELLQRIEGRAPIVQQAALQDRRHILTGDVSGAVAIWDVLAGTKAYTCSVKDLELGAALFTTAADGSLLVSDPYEREALLAETAATKAATKAVEAPSSAEDCRGHKVDAALPTALEKQKTPTTSREAVSGSEHDVPIELDDDSDGDACDERSNAIQLQDDAMSRSRSGPAKETVVTDFHNINEDGENVLFEQLLKMQERLMNLPQWFSVDLSLGCITATMSERSALKCCAFVKEGDRKFFSEKNLGGCALQMLLKEYVTDRPVAKHFQEHPDERRSRDDVESLVVAQLRKHNCMHALFDQPPDLRFYLTEELSGSHQPQHTTTSHVFQRNQLHLALARLDKLLPDWIWHTLQPSKTAQLECVPSPIRVLLHAEHGSPSIIDTQKTFPSNGPAWLVAEHICNSSNKIKYPVKEFEGGQIPQGPRLGLHISLFTDVGPVPLTMHLGVVKTTLSRDKGDVLIHYRVLRKRS